MKENVSAFPKLEKFVITKCPKLVGGLPKCLQSLVNLEVSECSKFVCVLPKLASLQELNLEEYDEAMLRGDEVDDRWPITTLDQIKGSAGPLIALQELVIKKCGGLNVCGRRKDKGYFPILKF